MINLNQREMNILNVLEIHKITRFRSVIYFSKVSFLLGNNNCQAACSGEINSIGKCTVLTRQLNGKFIWKTTK